MNDPSFIQWDVTPPNGGPSYSKIRVTKPFTVDGVVYDPTQRRDYISEMISEKIDPESEECQCHMLDCGYNTLTASDYHPGELLEGLEYI